MMNWKLPIFGGSQQPQSQPNYQDIPTQSWYPPSVSTSTSRPPTPRSFAGVSNYSKPTHPHSPSHVHPSPSEAAGVIDHLRGKSIDELKRLLNDKEAYNAFFNSLGQVKDQNKIRDDVRRENLELAERNLEEEPRITELRNQCTIIWTSELAAEQEKLTELERQKDEILKVSSLSGLLDNLHDAMNKVEEESELLPRQLLDKEIDLPTFIQKYKKLRITYHKRALIRLGAKASGL